MKSGVFLGAVPLLLVGTIPACNGGPTAFTFINPTMETITIDTAAIGSLSALVVRATPADGELPVTLHTRIRMTVRTGAGDVEQMQLFPTLCGKDGQEIFCNEFLVAMHSERDIADLKSLAEELPGRVIQTGTCVSDGVSEPRCTLEQAFGSVMIFEGDLEAAMDEAQDWPGVRSVDFSAPLYLGHVTQKRPRNGFVGGAPIAFAPPVPRDGVLQLRTGDMLEVEYLQPEGQTITARVTVRN